MLVAVTALAVPAGAVARWGTGMVRDGDAFARATAAVVQREDVQFAASREASDRLLASFDAEAVVRESLDATLGPDDGPARRAAVAATTRLVTAAVRESVDRALRSDAAASIWQGASARAHAGVRWALTTDAPAASGGSGAAGVTADGVVLLDLGALAAVAADGLRARDLPVPAALERVDLAFPVLQSDELARARTAYRAADGVRGWAWPVAVVAGVLAVGLARRRALTVVVLGVAVLAASGAVWTGVGRAPGLVELAVDETRLRGLVADQVAVVMVGSLRAALAPALWAGAVLAGAGLVWALVPRLSGRPGARLTGDPAGRPAVRAAGSPEGTPLSGLGRARSRGTA